MADEIPGDGFAPTTPPEPTGLFHKRKGKSKDATPRQPSKPRGRSSKHDQRKEKLYTLLSTTGGAVMFFEQFDGTVIMQHAEDVAEATATLADEVPAVAKAIDAMSTGGAYGAFFIALCSMVLPILSHHNIIPSFIATALVPDEEAA